MGKGRLFNIGKITGTTVWKTDRGYIYITKDGFLWKEEEDLFPKANDKYYCPPIKHCEISELTMFERIVKLGEDYDWADWWVMRHVFKEGELNYNLLAEEEEWGFTEEYSKKIGYNPVKYTHRDITVDKTMKNTIKFYFKNANKYEACKIIEYYLREVASDSVIIDTKLEIRDWIDFYKLIRSRKKIKITMSDEDYQCIKSVKFFLKEIN